MVVIATAQCRALCNIFTDEPVFVKWTRRRKELSPRFDFLLWHTHTWICSRAALGHERVNISRPVTMAAILCRSALSGSSTARSARAGTVRSVYMHVCKVPLPAQHTVSLCTSCTLAICAPVSHAGFFFCTLFLRHTCLLACVHAEAAAKAIVKCNGMTLLSWQFVVTACLSAWLDGCCTWETRLSHAIARLDWMSCINLQYLFLQILQCHALYLTFFRSLVCSFMHTSCTYFVVSRAHIWVPPNWTAKLSRLSTETLATILRSFSSKTSLWCFSFPLFYIFVRGIFSSF